MKNISLLTVFIIFNSLLSYGQFFDLSLGGSIYGTEKSQIGINFGMSLNHFYFDLSSNMATGKGEELNFSSSSTYGIDKIWVGVMNVGYNIYIKDKWFITPIIGYGQSKNIYEDPILFATYFYGNTVHHFNIGLLTKFFISDNVGLIIGCGTFERFKFSLCYRL